MKLAARIFHSIKVFLAILFTFHGLAALGQAEQQKRKVYYHAFIGSGRSIFQSDIPAPSKFPTLDLRCGGGLSIPLFSRFEIRSRVSLGLKAKREMTNQPGSPGIVPGPFATLDEISGRDHYFYEVPVIVQYHLPHPKISIGAGANYRHFFDAKKQNGSSFDPMSNKNEIGALGKLSYRFNDRISAGLEHYFAFNKLYTSGGAYDNVIYYMTVKNQFTQIVVEVRLK